MAERRWFAAPPTEAVLGHRLAPPRATLLGVWLAILYLGLPLLALLILLDVVVWAIAKLAFGACVAVWCWF